MRDLNGRTAVVTGGAAGIGLGLAERFAREGMGVVIGDVEERALAAAEKRLSAAGANVLALRADVTSPGSLAELRDRALERFGAVHVVCANAGVAPTGPVVGTPADWRWVVEVNLLGVSLLCPGAVATGIFASERNRPAALGGAAAAPDAARRGFQDAIRGGMAPAQVADAVVAAIRAERFYVLTHPELGGLARTRADDIAAGRSPTQGF
jgi:NADP-dependent 3-hydroxy acid dehydrogenase YdfG